MIPPVKNTDVIPNEDIMGPPSIYIVPVNISFRAILEVMVCKISEVVVFNIALGIKSKIVLLNL